MQRVYETPWNFHLQAQDGVAPVVTRSFATLQSEERRHTISRNAKKIKIHWGDLSMGAPLTEKNHSGSLYAEHYMPCSDAWASSGIKRWILLSMYFALHFLLDGCGFGAITTWRILRALSTVTSYCFEKNKESLCPTGQKQSSTYTACSSCALIYLTTTLQEQLIFQWLQGLIILIPWSRSFQRGFSTACSFCRL